MKSIQNVIKQLINDNQLEEPFLFARIISAWNDNFSATFKSNITLLELKNKTLYVRIQSPVWRQEAQLMSDKIIISLNEALGSSEIEQISIRR